MARSCGIISDDGQLATRNVAIGSLEYPAQQRVEQRLPLTRDDIPQAGFGDDANQAAVLLVLLEIIIRQSHHIPPAHQRLHADRYSRSLTRRYSTIILNS